jgi:hypothetical protein
MVDVDAAKRQARVLTREFVIVRLDRPAWAAPLGAEIDNHPRELGQLLRQLLL